MRVLFLNNEKVKISLVLALALTLRIAYMLRLPEWEKIQPDSGVYLQMAKNLVSEGVMKSIFLSQWFVLMCWSISKKKSGPFL